MTKPSVIVGALAAGAMICGMLRADDSASAPPPASGASWQEKDAQVWWIEHSAAIDDAADASGVRAVIEAEDFLKAREPQVAIDFFNKALFDAKNRPVQREIRMALYNLYKQTGQNDKALDQLQMLILDQ
jgi:hypothetical protein